MTFYSIVFGMVFVGAIRLVAMGLLAPSYEATVLGLLISLLTFNDVLYTTHYMERHPDDYYLALKLIDFANALLLTIAVVAASPQDNFLLQERASITPNSIYDRMPFLLLLLATYWFGACCWNSYECGQLRLHNVEPWVRAVMLAFLALAALAWASESYQMRGAAVLADLGVVVVYLALKTVVSLRSDAARAVP